MLAAPPPRGEHVRCPNGHRLGHKLGDAVVLAHAGLWAFGPILSIKCPRCGAVWHNAERYGLPEVDFEGSA